MSRSFTSKQISTARKKELYEFLLSNHARAIKRSGSTVVLKKQKHIKVRNGEYWERWERGGIMELCGYINQEMKK